MNRIRNLVVRLQFWWATLWLKDGKHFEISVDDLGLLVTILRGRYKKVQFRYANMIMSEDGLGRMDFNTVVVYNPMNADVGEPKFAKLSTNILRLLLAEMVRDFSSLTANKQVMNENRDTDTFESNQERDFHEESTPVLEKRVSKRKPRKKAVRTDKPVHPEVQQPAKPKRTRVRTPREKRPK